MKIASLAEAATILNGFIPRPINVHAAYNLETISKLAAYVGDPQNKMRVVHVAGTSGKTSTSHYIAALLKASGKKVGLTVSPHISEVNERVQINLIPMPEPDFCRALGEFMDLVAASGLKPTYFEILMTFAYWEFARQGVDYAVIETGLGGLLDGSNIASRADKVCVITDIGLDHMHILGNTIAEIAAQKAGIIHDQNPVFMHVQPEAVMGVIERACDEHHAALHVLAPAPSLVPALPPYQQRNLALAAAAAEFVLERDNGAALTPQAITQAATIQVPGRMEVFRVGKKTIVLDGAHNPQKLAAMAAGMHAGYPDAPVAALVGFVQSKEASLAENAQLIAGLAGRVITTEFGTTQEHGPASLAAHDVAAACRAAGVSGVLETTKVDEAVQALLDSPEQILLVTGSLYLISYVRPLILARVGKL
ncbi:MAG TPA: Mur ligase family protein [Candidatus Saccharimonadales bacterium]|nr:Mur ligase family protein [Candidatus Saccharimonadales bacterium]